MKPYVWTKMFFSLWTIRFLSLLVEIYEWYRIKRIIVRIATPPRCMTVRNFRRNLEYGKDNGKDSCLS